MEQVGQHRGGLVEILAGHGVGHLEHHRVDLGDGHRVHILPGDPGVGGIGGDFGDLRRQGVHQVAAQKDEVAGILGVHALARLFELAADPVGQIPLALPLEIHHRSLPFEQPRQLGPPVRLVGQQVVYKHHAAIVRQLLQHLHQPLPGLFPQAVQVEVGDNDQGAPAHHGQAVRRLLDPVHRAVLPLGGVQVELLQPGGQQGLLELPQIVIPQKRLLPVEEVELFGRALLDGPLQLPHGGVVRFILFRRHGDRPLSSCKFPPGPPAPGR